MRNVTTLKLSLAAFFLFTFTCFAAAPPAGTDDASAIIQEALKPSPLESDLHHLTDEIGGRIPGTPAMQHAVQWGLQAFKAAGADMAHTEGFTIPVSWSEGATEMIATAFYEGGDAQVGGMLPIVL